MEATIMITSLNKMLFLPCFVLLLLRSHAMGKTIEYLSNDEFLGANELWPGADASYPTPFGVQIPVTGDGNLSRSWDSSRDPHKSGLVSGPPWVSNSMERDCIKNKNQRNKANARQGEGRKMKSFHLNKASNGGMSVVGQPRRALEEGRLRVNVSNSHWVLVCGGVVSVFTSSAVIWGIVGRLHTRDEQLNVVPESQVEEAMSSSGRSIYIYAAMSSAMGLFVFVIYLLGKKYCKK